MEKVLILDGGAAHAMAIAECLKKSGYMVGVICDNKNEYGFHTKFADERYIGPDSHDKGYVAFMLKFLKAIVRYFWGIKAKRLCAASQRVL